MSKIAKRILLTILFILPFIIGFAGYLLQDESVSNALYGAFSLYFVSELVDPQNALAVIARWVSPLATFSGFFIALSSMATRIYNRVISHRNDSLAFYSDNEDMGTLPVVDEFKNHIVSIQSEEAQHFYPQAQNQILMFTDDNRTLSFLEEHEEELQGKNVYIMLRDIDCALLKKSNYHFFNVYDIIAEDYWFNRPMKDSVTAQTEVSVAIIGSGISARKLLEKALLLNLYSLNQHITYHLFGDWESFRNQHMDFMFLNKDELVYHGEEVYASLETLKKTERIIVMDEDTTLLNTILQSCTRVPVDVFSPAHSQYQSLLSAENLTCFGSFNEVCTRENICLEARHRLAKELNLRYVELYGIPSSAEEAATLKPDLEEEWQKLDGFTKESNLAAAAYHKMRVKLTNQTEDELCQIEHIRWTRFHSLNFWQYGVPADGKAKDKNLRIHIDMVPYEKLSEIDKGKDLETVKLLQGLYGN